MLSLALLAVCHTVIPEERDGHIVFQASSPDEAALVAGAELMGYRFHVSRPAASQLTRQIRKPRSVFIDVNGVDQEYQILNICEFNSSRKRMSAIIRGPDGRIKLYTKGADTVIFERLAADQDSLESTLTHLEVCQRP